jgi:glutamate--cysteine ligase
VTSILSAGDPTPIRSRTQLVDYIARGERPRASWLVGSEYEKIALHAPTGAPLPYEAHGDTPGIRTLLEELTGCCGWVPGYDAGALISLKSTDASVTLEPGGQFELSGAPLPTVHEMVTELQRHEAELAHLADRLPLRWLWVGANPLHSLDEIDWMPKRRYGIMRRYLPTRGRYAKHMMQSTCTVQANLDFEDERDMGDKLRTSMGVSSIVTAMFANSPLQEGKPSGFKSFRANVWSDVDPDRQGLLDHVFDGVGPTYDRWIEYALKVPLFFIMRGDDLFDCAGLPFGDFLRNGFQGHEARMGDWELHLSTLFPDVRLKTYLEMRTADCVKPAILPALPALWKGLLYDPSARAAAWDLVKGWSMEERWAHREAVARDALAAPAPGGRFQTLDLARELLAIAAGALRGMAEPATLASGEGVPDESVHLHGLEALIASGRCPADVTLAWYERTKPSPEQIIAHYEASWAEF